MTDILEATRFPKNKPTPTVKVGDKLRITDTVIEKSMVNAYIPYTEASLLYDMDKYGLGTSATRASTIERLLQVQYLTRRDKLLCTIEKGRFVIERMPIPELKSVDYTAHLEKELDEIVENKRAVKTTEDKVKQLVQDAMLKFKELQGREYIAECPKCHKGIVLNGLKGYGCSAYGKGCDFVVLKEEVHKRLKVYLKDDVFRELCEKGACDTLLTGTYTAKPISLKFTQDFQVVEQSTGQTSGDSTVKTF